MVTIGNKEVIFSKSLIMLRGETAVIVPDGSETINLRISLHDKVVSPNDPNKGVEEGIDGIVYSLAIPFDGFGTKCIVVPQIGITPEGKLSLRLTQHGGEIGALVQVDVLFERNEPEGTMQDYLDSGKSQQ